jgi:ADP-dependent NAD(P)H-hydrate dehydratase / NAD(P)H-hydrate epimerase
VPTIEGHKYSRGHAVVVSGSLAHTGAARLAAMAALRGGAGLVTIASPRDALAVNAAANLAVMVRPVEAPVEFEHLLTDRRFNAVAIGPGAGVALRTREMSLIAMADERAVVLDADALMSFADHTDALFTALARNRHSVLTPHAGEFNRLFAKALETIPAASVSKLLATRAAAGRAGAVVVQKGADTVIAAPDGRAAINANAPPWLATAGTGDVLAGLVTGLMAQGMPAFEAAAAAVWIHGEAANAAGPGMISEDLPARFPDIFRKLYARAPDVTR